MRTAAPRWREAGIRTTAHRAVIASAQPSSRTPSSPQ
jgi:hypothetical protein